MKANGKLPPQSWMTAPATRAVTAALMAKGDEVRFVGGCVRDAVAKRPVKDIDLATPAKPERVMALLRDAGIKVVPTGLRHGTVTAVVEHQSFEITTLRLDVETYGRHAKVAFTDDWVADAARRDLTFNALSCRPDGTLFDPFGGVDDLRAGRVRFVGDARSRIEEDYLRLLRFFRFQATFGRGEPDAAAVAAASELAPNLTRLSGERLHNELTRLLAAKDPAPVVELMLARGVLAPILPEAGNLARLRELIAIAPAADSLLRLAALLQTDTAGARAIAERLRLSNREAARLEWLAASRSPIAADMPEAELRRALYKLGGASVGDAILLDWAGRKALGAPADDALLRAALRLVAAGEPAVLPLDGADLLDRGVPQGPAIGELLGQIEAWWVERDFAPDRAACLAELERRLAR